MTNLICLSKIPIQIKRYSGYLSAFYHNIYLWIFYQNIFSYIITDSRHQSPVVEESTLRILVEDSSYSDRTLIGILLNYEIPHFFVVVHRRFLNIKLFWNMLFWMINSYILVCHIIFFIYKKIKIIKIMT